MRVAMLGPFELRDRSHHPVDLGGHRVAALVARLALAPGTLVSTDTLVADLWDGSSARGGANAVQRLVSRARQALREHGVDDLAIVSRRGGYLLRVDPGEVDAVAFERAAAEGRRLLREAADERAADTLRRCLDLWRGPALVEFTAVDFARAAADRLAELRTAAAEDLFEAGLRLGRAAELLPELTALHADHPLRERTAGLLMLALRDCGRRAEALAVHERLRSALAEEFGVDPSPWVSGIHLELLRDDTARPAARRAPTAPAARPPSGLTRFVGREEELAELDRALTRSRLVTLFGPGGAGKTRLAAEYALRSERAGRPVRFVELSSLPGDADLAETVAAALGVSRPPLTEPPSAGWDRLDQLAAALSEERTLLVLDNCEHLVDEVAVFVHRLLDRCPGLAVLATSREPLALPGEALCPLGPLPVPASPDDAAESASVQLFRDRAGLVRPGFTVDADTVRAVVEICRRLDGLPLAIELAAARMRTMTVQQVADRLDDRFRLLSGSRASTARHRTLRAVLDWSWHLLEDAERALARRLSVMVGDATAESAARVCAGADLPPEDVLYLLSSLAEKSLVRVVERPPGEARYRMLETTRAYCRERLVEAGELAATENACTAYFLELAERAAEGLRGADQPRALALLDAEHDNLVRSLGRAVDADDTATAVRFCLALTWYWVMRGRYAEADRWFGALAALGDRVPPDARAVFATTHMVIPVPLDADRARRTAEAAALAEATDAVAEHPVMAVVEPKCWLLVGDYARLTARAERARRHPDPWVNAAGEASLALAAEASGDVGAAERHVSAALEGFRALGDRWMYGQLIGQWSEFRSLGGRNREAVRGLEEALEAVRQVGSADDLTPLLIRLGSERLRSGLLDEAERSFTEALAATRSPAPEYRIMVLVGRVELALARGRPDEARALLDEALVLLDDAVFGVLPLRVEVARRTAALEVDRGAVAATGEAAATAARLAAESGDMALRAKAAETAAEVALAEGAPERAARLLGEAARLRGVPDDGSPRVRSLTASLRAALGDDGYLRNYRAGRRGAD